MPQVTITCNPKTTRITESYASDLNGNFRRVVTVYLHSGSPDSDCAGGVVGDGALDDGAVRHADVD